ncbi:Cathepsin L [Spironucleus salmonicida]|uniref:Cathepsin L n=1 Tax=Spironucleus salmonicida TaxID=348837 RepID=V6LIV5_9EUKA|nr:Cathepsin L [Spironucleus salmonicida]|eukprot:EST44253.1 Cathepsin L [Spironucleus salmonicida]
MLAVLALPVYSQFIANITYSIPYANNTQYATVYQGSQSQRYQWYNDDKIIDINVIYSDSYKYLRTENDKQSCYYYKGGEKVDFVPMPSSNWKDLGKISLMGMQVNHFQLVGFDNERRFEQNFYTKTDEMKTPIRWEMYSISNFHSHYDIYIIEYNTFDLVAPLDNIFDIPEVINGVQISRACDLKPQDESTPAGPTYFNNFKIQPKIASRKSANHRNDFYEVSENLPKTLDWRVSGVVGSIQDQVFCGSCWAFSATATLESRINVQLLKTKQADKPFITVSPQQVVDCYWNFTGDILTQSTGCEGGDENAVLAFWAQKKQMFITEEKNYPYIGQNDFCKENESNMSVNIIEYKTVPANDVQALKTALLNGPVSVGISVTKSLLSYQGGVYRDENCSSNPEDISHAVNVVGWGVSEIFEEYWIVRNSWSPRWGDNGYIYIAIAGNICSVMSIAAYVDISLN